jgi:hypothetical protein
MCPPPHLAEKGGSPSQRQRGVVAFPRNSQHPLQQKTRAVAWQTTCRATAPILRFVCRRAAIAPAYRATSCTLAPSFIGACSTSFRHAPRAIAAMTAARTIAPFMLLLLRSLREVGVNALPEKLAHQPQASWGHALPRGGRRREQPRRQLPRVRSRFLRSWSSLLHVRQSHHLATGAQRLDQERSCFCQGFPRWLMRKCHWICDA